MRQLMPAVASYTGKQAQVRAALSPPHLAAVVKVALAPQPQAALEQSILADLQAMHVVTVKEGLVRLMTAVFLEEDIPAVVALARRIGRRLAEQVCSLGADLLAASPEIRNFLGGIIAAAQGPSRLLRQTGIASDWRDYPGIYAGTKVDFDQECPAWAALGPELQSKLTLAGERYTAVFIGPGGHSFLTATNAVAAEQRSYRRQLLRFLTDSYGDLLAGQTSDPSLLAMAAEVGLATAGRPLPLLVTEEVFARHAASVQRIAAVASEAYCAELPAIAACLQQTASGRQGVPTGNMLMHFGRYCRKALARELYACHFFTDAVPSAGCITVFYRNDIAELRSYLS